MKKLLALLALAPLLAAGDCSGGDTPRRQTDGHYPPNEGPVAPIPEPTAGLLFGVGLFAVAYHLRKRS